MKRNWLGTKWIGPFLLSWFKTPKCWAYSLHFTRPRRQYQIIINSTEVDRDDGR